MQVWYMIAIGVVCLISALDWAYHGDYKSAFAFGMFGLGYFGLGAEFW